MSEEFQNKIYELKGLLINESEFKETFKYFFDNLADHRNFLKQGEKSKAPILKKAFAKIGKEVFGTPGQVTNLLCIYIKRYKMYHGPCLIDGKMSTFFFFEDLDMGMIGIDQGSNLDYMSYIRFTSYQIEGNKPLIICEDSKKVQ
ncbi:hypothetical protein AKJ60_00870 [candidate division MSBL1 archaeon SCGC-AAA385M11]|nr:hypothetical protein AKJ60_00870 [candidate division MSBL1 archaeon SCGC-AAA385M11]